MAKFCANCGSPLDGAGKFCPSCGAKVMEESSQGVPPSEVNAEETRYQHKHRHPHVSYGVDSRQSDTVRQIVCTYQATRRMHHHDEEDSQQTEQFDVGLPFFSHTYL